MNERIRFPRVRVIDEEGRQLGIMPTKEALRLAREKGLDLVEVAPHERPPVCRIMDFGKFLYEQKKRQKEAAKKQKIASDLKEIRLKLSIGEHDLQVKVRNAEEFLQEGRRVRFILRLRGREKAEKHTERARELLRSIAGQLSPLANVVEGPLHAGSHMILTLAPKRPRERPQRAEGKEREEGTQGQQEGPSEG